jgi:hypothetical protein
VRRSAVKRGTANRMPEGSVGPCRLLSHPRLRDQAARNPESAATTRQQRPPGSQRYEMSSPAHPPDLPTRHRRDQLQRLRNIIDPRPPPPAENGARLPERRRHDCTQHSSLQPSKTPQRHQPPPREARGRVWWAHPVSTRPRERPTQSPPPPPLIDCEFPRTTQHPPSQHGEINEPHLRKPPQGHSFYVDDIEIRAEY